MPRTQLGMHCDECERFLLDLKCATAEAVAVQQEIIARKRADENLSPTLQSWSIESKQSWETAIAAVNAHRMREHRRGRVAKG
jgi:hypothetical protein